MRRLPLTDTLVFLPVFYTLAQSKYGIQFAVRHRMLYYIIFPNENALKIAIKTDNIPGILQLLTLGTNVNCIVSGRYPLHYAIRENNAEAFLLLLDNGSDFDYTDLEHAFDMSSHMVLQVIVSLVSSRIKNRIKKKNTKKNAVSQT